MSSEEQLAALVHAAHSPRWCITPDDQTCAEARYTASVIIAAGYTRIASPASTADGDA